MNGREARERRVSLIRKAGLAPSSHNTQPWLFRPSDSAIDLHADPARALPVNDPQDRELIISCGCALMNLRVAAAGAGLANRVELLPDRDEPNWLARLSFTGKSVMAADEVALAPFIDRRRSYRKPFLSRAVDPPVLDRLMEAAQGEGAWLRPLAGGADRQRVAELVAEGDARQWANRAWRCELAAWMRPPRRGDGLAVPPLVAPVARFLVRRFDLGARVGAKDRAQAATSPLLAVLGTEGDQRRDWLLAGQALERLLLVACRHGLQASYLNQPVQVASLRRELQSLTGGGSPQLLLRLGYPAKVLSATPRREVAEVIIEAEHLGNLPAERAR